MKPPETYPAAVRQAIQFMEKRDPIEKEGSWEISMDLYEMFRLHTHFDEFRDRNFKPIYNAGGLLVHAIKRKKSEDPRRPKSDSILTLLYPATHQDSKMFFDKYEFGRDVYTSVVTGKLPDPLQNSEARISERREAALEIFDSMLEEGNVCLAGISETAADIRFIERLETRRANYWGDLVWAFYDRFYARESDKGIHAFSKAFCRKMARDSGEFHLGGWSGGL